MTFLTWLVGYYIIVQLHLQLIYNRVKINIWNTNTYIKSMTAEYLLHWLINLNDFDDRMMGENLNVVAVFAKLMLALIRSLISDFMAIAKRIHVLRTDKTLIWMMFMSFYPNTKGFCLINKEDTIFTGLLGNTEISKTKTYS